MKAFLKIERCGEVFSVRSEKTEQGTISKRVVVLSDWCGRYPDRYVAVMLGAVAEADVCTDDIIYGELRFQTHDHNEQTYQDITLVNFVKGVCPPECAHKCIRGCIQGGQTPPLRKMKHKHYEYQFTNFRFSVPTLGFHGKPHPRDNRADQPYGRQFFGTPQERGASGHEVHQAAPRAGIGGRHAGKAYAPHRAGRSGRNPLASDRGRKQGSFGFHRGHV